MKNDKKLNMLQGILIAGGKLALNALKWQMYLMSETDTLIFNNFIHSALYKCVL